MGATLDGRYLRGLSISGTGYTGQLEQITTSISLSLAIDKVTELKLNLLDDHALTLFRSKLMDQGASMHYGEWAMTVDKVDLTAGKAGPELSVSALSTMVYKWQKQFGAKTWTNVDISQWFRDRCKEVGATALVQPGLGRRTIVRESNLEAGFQNTWEVMSTVKRETGVWMFERGRTFVVGKPTWVAKQYRDLNEWRIWWNGWGNYHTALTGLPSYSGRNDKARQQTLSFEMTSADADRIKPGDRVVFTGTHIGSMGGTWLVSEVGFPLHNAGPVTISCLRVVDPVKEKTTTTGLGSTEPTTATTPLTGLPAMVAGYAGEQLVNAAHLLRTAQTQGLPTRAAHIATTAAMTTTRLRSLNYSTTTQPTARGLLQEPDTWGTYDQRMDPAQAAELFYTRLQAIPAWTTTDPARLAATLSGAPDHAPYAVNWPTAISVLSALEATTPPTGALTTPSDLDPAVSVAIDRYIRATTGRAIDVDKIHGPTCVDLANHYTVAMGGPRIWGNGKDWYRAGGSTKFYTRISPTATARKGDVACWGSSTGGGWGHVAIVIQDQGSTLRCLSQNPGASAILNLSRNGLDGMLRPNLKVTDS